MNIEERTKTFVTNNVICNVTTLVDAVMDEELRAELAYRPSPVSYIEDLILGSESEVQDIRNAAEYAGYNFTPDEEVDRLRNILLSVLNDDIEVAMDILEELGDQMGLEEYDQDVLQFWFVTEAFGRALQDVGECVNMDWYGHVVWGRTTVGQAIYMDAEVRNAVAKFEEKLSRLDK